jgi:hypothetical protein
MVTAPTGGLTLFSTTEKNVINRPLKWLATRNLKLRAKSLATPVLETLEQEIRALQEGSKFLRDEYLRSEVQKKIKELYKSHKNILDACTSNALERESHGIPWLEKKIDSGLQAVERSEDARRERVSLVKRIQSADAALNAILAVVMDLPSGAAKEHRDAMTSIRRLRAELANEKRQRQFYSAMERLEVEIQEHRMWIEGMESVWRELLRAKEQLDSLVSLGAWETTKGGAEGVEQARRHLTFATNAWNAGRWPKSASCTQDAIRQIELVRNTADRTLSQARDEIAMWRTFIQTSRSYPEMKRLLASFPAELSGTDLQRWEDYRHETSRQIAAAAFGTAHLRKKMPFRSFSVLDWKEQSCESHCNFAREVREGCEEIVSLLTARHQKRRRRYRTPTQEA